MLGNMSWCFSLEALSPFSHACQFFLKRHCPQPRHKWKATDVAKIVPSLFSVLFHFWKGKWEKERWKLALNHWSVLYLSKSVCTWSSSQVEKAESFTFSLRSVLMLCSVVHTLFTWSSCLWLLEQIEVIQATSSAAVQLLFLGKGGKALEHDQLGLPTINRRIRFDTLKIKTFFCWKVGRNDINYKTVIWRRMVLKHLLSYSELFHVWIYLIKREGKKE